ncbi:ribonuclease P protein component [Desulfitispora alkaliphila]|uniref:ribonuclease P protein component n=1 Tax=Desulfitispora alkaliphila TaxID=622674 RepID=UPI003D25DA7C
MLPSNLRLKRNEDFKKVYRQGKSVASRNIVLYWLPVDNKNPRFGFSVSKRVGNAVCRNRVKRVLRGVVMKKLDKLPNYDYIIIARQNIVNTNFAALEKEFDYLLRKGKI